MPLYLVNIGATHNLQRSPLEKLRKTLLNGLELVTAASLLQGQLEVRRDQL